jgi:hypothetical protein
VNLAAAAGADDPQSFAGYSLFAVRAGTGDEVAGPRVDLTRFFVDTIVDADRYRTVLEEGALQLAPEPMQQAVKARLGRIAFELGCERLKKRGAL